MEKINTKCPRSDKYIGKADLYSKGCIICKKIKSLNDFYVLSGYYASCCKDCSKKRSLLWKRKNIEKVREYKRILYKKNPEKILRQQREWHKKSTEVQKQHTKDYMHEYGKAYYMKNKLRISKQRLIRERKNSQDPIKKLHKNMSRSIRWHLKKNNHHTFSLLGYSATDLKKHLEEQFLPGMSWDNYGIHGWHIDHKIPISAFNFNEINNIDFKKCWALSNLQPLWADENHKKYNKLAALFQPSLAIAV
jgi:hypothetical protein